MKLPVDKKLVKQLVDRDEMRFWFDTIQMMYLGDRIDDKTYRALLSIMVAEDSEGRVWTIGTRSGKWYRKEGKNWVEGRPDKRLAMLAPEAELSRIEDTFRKLEDGRKRRVEDWEKQGRPKPPGFMAGGIEAAEKRIVAGNIKQPEQTAKIPEILHCAKCGTLLPDGSRFCLNCGEPVKSPVSENPVCGSCGAENEAGARFCSNCGAPLNR